MEAGSVQGVVVQMMVKTFLPAAPYRSAGSPSERVLYPDGRAGVVFVFDFGFSERRFVVHAPVHRAQPFVNESVLIKR